MKNTVFMRMNCWHACYFFNEKMVQTQSMCESNHTTKLKISEQIYGIEIHWQHTPLMVVSTTPVMRYFSEKLRNLFADTEIEHWQCQQK